MSIFFFLFTCLFLTFGNLDFLNLTLYKKYFDKILFARGMSCEFLRWLCSLLMIGMALFRYILAVQCTDRVNTYTILFPNNQLLLVKLIKSVVAPFINLLLTP